MKSPVTFRYLPFVCLILAIGCGHPAPAVVTAGVTPDTAIGEAVTLRAFAAGRHHHSFADGDETLDSGALAHRYVATLSPGTRYRITMESEELDCLLSITGPDDFSLRSDDAFPGTLNSVLDFTPAVEGRYELVASTYGRAEGDYALTILESPTEGAGAAVDFESGIARRLAGPDGPGMVVDWLRFEGEEAPWKEKTRG